MSDLYDRCPHNERPSRCLACAHDTIERLHSDVADLMAAKLAEQRQTVQMSRMYDGVVDLLRELRPLLDRDDLKRHYVAVRDRIDAALAGTADQPSGVQMWKLYRVGGRWPYWQCATPHGPYTFQADTEQEAEAVIAKMRAADQQPAPQPEAYFCPNCANAGCTDCTPDQQAAVQETHK